MRVPCRAESNVAPRGPRPGRRRSAGLLVVGIVVGAVVLDLVTRAREYLTDWGDRRGHHVFEHTSGFWSALGAVPGRLTALVDAPELVLDVKFEDMQRIWAKRTRALERGLLEAHAGDLVPGHATFHGVRVPIRLRLKGDHTDHIEHERKWSFRIETRGDDHLAGMRRLSIQRPPTKGYHGEAVFHAAMRAAGVVAPRYEFVRVTLNGDDLGVMALEEHFSPELLVTNQRAESVIVRFDEWLMFHGVDDYRVAVIRAFRNGWIDRSPTRRRHRDQAIGLLRAFTAGELRASDVFDVDELAAHLATAELWGSTHSLRWHNQRFYFDPHAGKLGPVAFDGNLHERLHRTHDRRVVSIREPLVAAMLADPVVFDAFRRRLAELCDLVLDGDLLAKLRAVEADHLPLLRTEYPLLAELPWDDLRERARFHRSLPPTAYREAAFHDHHALTLRVTTTATAAGVAVEIRPATRLPAEIRSMHWTLPAGGRAPIERLDDGPALPFALPPAASANGTLPVAEVQLAPAPAADAQLTILTSLAGRSVVESTAVWSTPAATTPVVPTTAVGAPHPFVTHGDDATSLRIRAGDHVVTHDLVVPDGHTLAVPAGVRLRFAADAALIAHGALAFEGTAEAPIRLEPQAGAERWPGVIVLGAATPSRWRHVHVRAAAGLARDRWTTTGGVTFCDTTVELEEVSFADGRAEDALNLVRGRFTVRSCRFVNTRSDAIDSDFATGTVEHSEFTAIGGDGVDISGATVHVDSCRFDGVHDKALSVGEGSAMTAANVTIANVGTAAACKDGSTLGLTTAQLVDCRHFGVVAYVKKPEFGGATVTATAIERRGSTPAARAQAGCRVEVDGRVVEPEALDVDALYETVMRKDAGAR